MPADPIQAATQAAMQATLTGPFPRFYINGLGIAMSAGDMIVTMVCNGAPVGIINLSLPTAKGFAEDLTNAVKEYERISEQSVQTTGQIAATMQRVREAQGIKE